MMKRWSSIAKNCSSREFCTMIPQNGTSPSIPVTLLSGTAIGLTGYVIFYLVQPKTDQRRSMKRVEETHRLEKLSDENED